MTDEFPLSLNRKRETPKLYFEFLWLNIPPLFKQVEATFRINKNFELVAVGDELYKDAECRLLTLVFKEVEKPKFARRAFSLKTEWELTNDGFQTLDTIKKEESVCGERKKTK